MGIKTAIMVIDFKRLRKSGFIKIVKRMWKC